MNSTTSYTCIRCGQTFEDDGHGGLVDGDGRAVCLGCLDYGHYMPCGNCGSLVPEGEYLWDEDKLDYFCPDCYKA